MPDQVAAPRSRPWLRRRLDVREPGPGTASALRLAANVTTGVLVLTALVMLLVGRHGHTRMATYDPLVVCAFGLWVANILAALPRWRTTAVYLVLHLSLFLFILANPVIDVLDASVSLNKDEQVGAPTIVWCLILSLLSLRAGCELVLRLTRRRGVAPARPDAAAPVAALPLAPGRTAERLLAALAAVTALAAFARGLEAWLFVHQHSYSAYFAHFHTRLPGPVIILAFAAPAFLACYLATFPRTRTWPAVLALHVAATLPVLALGQRGPAMRALAFAGMYVFLRWLFFGRRRGVRVPVAALLGVALLVPVGMAGLGELQYRRSGEARSTAMDPVTDFVYSQSITYSVACRGIYVRHAMPGPRPTVYTVGAMTDFVLYGVPGRALFGNAPIDGNNLRHAQQGHEFAHSFSYYAYRKDYLAGLGSGTTYLIETYLDAGFALVMLYSALLGAFLVALVRGYSRRWLPNVVLLLSLAGIFTLPRDNATGFLVFLLTPHFWLAVVTTGAVLWWDRRRQASSSAKSR